MLSKCRTCFSLLLYGFPGCDGRIAENCLGVFFIMRRELGKSFTGSCGKALCKQATIRDSGQVSSSRSMQTRKTRSGQSVFSRAGRQRSLPDSVLAAKGRRSRHGGCKSQKTIARSQPWASKMAALSPHWLINFGLLPRGATTICAVG